jgi:hypothetical protein
MNSKLLLGLALVLSGGLIPWYLNSWTRIRSFGCGVVIAILCIHAGSVQQVAAAGFHLDLDRPALQAGDIAERKITMTTEMHNSITSGAGDVTTNNFTFSELEGREKILKWDPAGDFSKTDLEVKHLISVDNLQTNELVKPGTHIIGTSIAGESFFQSQNGRLPEPAYQLLQKIYAIRPRDFDSFPKPRLPQKMAVGECLKLRSPLTMSNYFGDLGINLTNGMDGTVCLIGTTNLFGLDCFHLQTRVISTNTPFNPFALMAANMPAVDKGLLPKYHSQMNLLLDYVEPLDPAQKSFNKSFTMKWSDNAEMSLPDKMLRSQGHFTLQIVSEYRYLGHER